MNLRKYEPERKLSSHSSMVIQNRQISVKPNFLSRDFYIHTSIKGCMEKGKSKVNCPISAGRHEPNGHCAVL